MATALPQTYSFVPNLAWLPAQIAKLTDHEGAYAQQILQAVAFAYYYPARQAHPPALSSIWDALPPPELAIEIDPGDLNTYVVTSRAINIRRGNLLREIESVEQTALSGAQVRRSPRAFRYLGSLAGVPPEQTAGMLAWLSAYRDFLAHS